MKKQALKQIEPLAKPAPLQTWCVAPCYELFGKARKRGYRRTGHTIDPASHFEIKETLIFQNRGEKRQFAVLDLIDPKTKLPALIWDMHIFVTKQSAGKGKL